MKKSLSKGYCNRCGKITDGQSRGVQFKCSVCGKFTIKERTTEKFQDNGETAQYTVVSEKRITSIVELEALCAFDRDIWKIEKWEQEAGVSEGYRKDRKGEWTVDEHGAHGHVEDSGKMLVVPLHSFKIRIWLVRKTEEIRNNLVVNEFTVKALKFSPKYKKINYKRNKGEFLFELGLPDLQLGRLVSAEDAGFDLSPEIQIKKADAVVDFLIGHTKYFDVSRCLFPVGNDFFDTNSALMATAHGTLQEDDVRWKRTYKMGCDFIIRTIEKMQQIAPTDILIIPGNHDQDKIWHLGEYVHAWNHKNPNVIVDNRGKKRKYYAFKNNLICLTHGYDEKNIKLDSLMAYEEPLLWAKSTHREVHLGHRHHKVDMEIKQEEFDNGVVIRILRSLATPSVWEFDKGLVGSMKAGEAFLWHETKGVVAQFTEAG